jgi:hypothetical protein
VKRLILKRCLELLWKNGSLRKSDTIILRIVKHLFAFNMCQMTKITIISETIIMVKAALANPISYFIAFLCLSRIFLIDTIIQMNFVLLRLRLLFYQRWWWRSIKILTGSGLLTSFTFSTTLEIVISTSAAIPSSFWKLKFVFLIRFYLKDLRFSILLRIKIQGKCLEFLSSLTHF